MDDESLGQDIRDRVSSLVQSLGYVVVQLCLAGKKIITLQVMIEGTNRRGVTIDECAQVSRDLSTALDVEDISTDAYVLEVSSPGIERPLVCLEDFMHYRGLTAKIVTRSDRGMDDRKGGRRYCGSLVDTVDDMVRINVEGEVVSIPLAVIKHAHLILDDKLNLFCQHRSSG